MGRSLVFPSAVPVLAGGAVRLRALTEDDIPGWFARASDAESAALSGDPIPHSVASGTAWLRRHAEAFREGRGIRWAIVPAAADNSLGTIGLAITSAERRLAELGIVVAREHWGRGFGADAIRLVTAYARTGLGLAEIHAEVLRRNGRSIRLLETAGFRRDDTSAAATSIGMGAEDCLAYALRLCAAAPGM